MLSLGLRMLSFGSEECSARRNVLSDLGERRLVEAKEILLAALTLA